MESKEEASKLTPDLPENNSNKKTVAESVKEKFF